ncbi:helix-turn-helix domain-containing protein [Nocardia sp. NPDC058114]|uniref:AlbA family DNA-binding domain-containing protein n=1 Tax=Nocardia sp. NPDC058114 TaxID=3346346 RepID=UPI0036D985D4
MRRTACLVVPRCEHLPGCGGPCASVGRGRLQCMGMPSANVVVVEPVVSEEKVKALLAVGNELSNLDYKRTVDLNEHPELVEFAKDVAAMRARGGYILIGADDQGQVTGDLTRALAKQFDEANLRQKLEKLLHPTGVIPAQHVVNGSHVVLVYVPCHPVGFTVVKAIGEYTKKGKVERVLRPGDVFLRRGTSSVRWNEDEVAGLLAARDEELREQYRKDFAATVAAIQTDARGQSLARGPARALTWQLDEASFDSAVLEMLRERDLAPIRLMLITGPGDALAAVGREDIDEYRTILDRLISLAGIALTLDQDVTAASVIDQLAKLYCYPPAPRHSNQQWEAVLWLEIIFRVEALGGLAVHLGKWDVVRRLALQPSPDPYWSIWLGHALVMGSRSAAFPMVNGRDEAGGFISRARRTTHRLPALRPYVQDDSGYDPEPGTAVPERDQVLDALCGFEAVAALIITTRPKRPTGKGSEYYPEFGNYFSRRSEPWWAKLADDVEFRTAVLGGVSDETLGDAMMEVADQTRRVTNFGVWEVETEPVRQLIAAARNRAQPS